MVDHNKPPGGGFACTAVWDCELGCVCVCEGGALLVPFFRESLTGSSGGDEQEHGTLYIHTINVSEVKPPVHALPCFTVVVNS